MAKTKTNILQGGDFSIQRPARSNKVKQMTAGSEPEIMIDDSKLFDTPLNEGFEMQDVDALAASMKEVGQLHAICVWEHEDGRYEIYSGCRRRHAWCRILGHKDIACKVFPYPADAESRWRAHFDANRQTRELNSTWWYRECLSAEDVLYAKGIGLRGRDEDKVGCTTILTSDDYMEAIGRMIGRSGRQVKRYLGVADLEKEIRDLEEHYGLSGNTLVLAKSLTPECQRRVAEIVAHEFEVKGESFDMSRGTFQGIVSDVAARAEGRPVRKKPTYSEEVGAASDKLLKLLARCKKKKVGKEEREKTLAQITALRSGLDEMERRIRDI